MAEGSRPLYIAVIGGGEAPPEIAALAREVGRELARRGVVVICGGLGGVMAAAARGVQEEGGVCLGILPDADRRRANPYLTYSLATNLGHARNLLIVHSAQGLIAVDGSYGTISEAALALKLAKPVVALAASWEIPGLIRADTPKEALDKLWRALGV
jgi:uncharacterized protein (TIGR00725 family)